MNGNEFTGTIIIQACPPLTPSAERVYVLVDVKTVYLIKNDVNTPYLRMALIRYAAQIVENSGARWISDRPPFVGMPMECLHERVSRRYGKTYYTSIMQKMHRHLYISGYGAVYEYGLTHANKILESEFYRIFTAQDRSKGYHFTLREEPLPSPYGFPPDSSLALAPALAPAPAPSRTLPVSTLLPVSIPVHIRRAYMDSLIEKKEACPISFNDFTKENIAITGCGHVFEKESLEKLLSQDAPTCPQCRAVVSKEDIEVY